jgi:M-phase inducer tyrosine phosphatase
MFQHPTDVMKEEQAAFERQPPVMPSSIMDVQQEYTPKLPSFVPEGEPDSLPRITPETMASVLDGKFSAQFAQTRVIDCRFEYEYKGGHISVAENHNDKEHLAAKLFDGSMPANSLIIFHCEYSVHRAPLSAKFIRNHDRKINAAQYPFLTHQEMYVLDGGYKGFYERFPEKCEGSYVEMNDERHELACERGMAKVKSQRQKLFRHSTFAFGDTAGHDEEMQDSPTTAAHGAGARHHAFRSHSSFEIGSSPSSFDALAAASPLANPFQRRLASY